MKKKLILLSSILSLSCLCSCNNSNESTEKENTSTIKEEAIVPSCLKTTASGRTYIEVGGKPFLYTGAAIRVDGYTHFNEKSLDELEYLFQYAHELGVKSIENQIIWGDIEKEEGVYDLRYIKQTLDWALEYDLKMDLIWVTPQECGWYLPEYIYEDEDRFPKYQTTHKGDFYWNGYHGTMVYDNKNLIEKEQACIKEVANFVYEWEKNHNNPNVVISFLVNNEIDNFVYWSLNDYQVTLPDGSRRLLEKEAWDALYTAINAEAKAFKESKYKALTRLNFVQLWSKPADVYNGYIKRFFDSEYIDMIGEDTYTLSIKSQYDCMENLRKGPLEGNFPHVAENSGNFSNTPSLIMSAITQGAGYLIYCLALPKGYVGEPGSEGYDYWEQGLLTVDWEEKPHTQETKNVLQGLNKAGSQIVVCDLDKMVGLNVKENEPLLECEEIHTLDGNKITYKTTNGGLGYAIVYDGYLTVFNTRNCTISVENLTATKAEYGYFNEFDFVFEGERTITNSTLNLEANVCYRIKL